MLAAVCVPAQAQSITAGSVIGVVTDEAGQPIAEAIVTLHDRTTGVERWGETQSNGRFAFGILYPGLYDLKAEQLGYRPALVRDVRVGLGEKAVLAVVLTPTEPPVTEIDSVHLGGSPVSRPGAMFVFPLGLAERLPLVGHDLAALDAVHTRSDGQLNVDGLPAWLVAPSVDGVTHGIARHPVLPTAGVDAVALPLMGFQNAGVLQAPSDVEWGDFAGSLLGGFARRGTQRMGFGLFADFSGSPGAGSDYFSPNDVTHSSWRGGLFLSGPIVPDTARFAIGAEAQRLQVPRAQPWIPTVWDSAVVAFAADSHGVDLGAYVGPRVVERELISAFGRFDWDFSQNHRASVSATFGTFTDGEADVGPAGVIAVGGSAEGTDILGTGTVLSRFSALTANELRIGFESSSRTYAGNGLPSTRVGGAIGFGTDIAQPGSFKRTGATVSDAFQLLLGNVQLKLGAFFGYTRHEQTYAYGDVGSYWFSDPDAFATGRGAFVGSVTGRSNTSFGSTRVGGMLQNTWTVFPGLDLLVGVRWDGEWLPKDELTRNDRWFELTGLRNDTLRTFVSKISPRFSFRWTLGNRSEWIVQGVAAQYRGGFDPAVMGEAIREFGGTSVSRGIGAVGWEGGTAGAAVEDAGARLTLIGVDYRDAGTAAITFGVARRLGAIGILELSTHYRHTSYLRRRHDLNLVASPAAFDQHGRPVYGVLVKEGAVIAPEPGSNRRFGEFDLVSALDPDGSSDRWGITARIEQPVGRFVRLLSSYTYSITTDNWLTGSFEGPYAELTPFPDSLPSGDWAEGTSDFDMPHRAAVGVEIQPLGRDALTLAALYRYASGRPFTPGFPRGVDINGDGSDGNDPAFVDGDIPGVTEMASRYPCLQVGQFAERNACRDPGLSTIDLRLGIGPVRMGGYPVELWVEALNVTDAELVVRDHALFLVDAASPLTRDPTAGTVTVPLVVNENFGEPVAYRGSGRSVRFGLRVNY